jgi:hypothetical protein
MPQVSYTNTDYNMINKWAQNMVSSIGVANLDAIEISNEPNEYGGDNPGPSALNAS